MLYLPPGDKNIIKAKRNLLGAFNNISDGEIVHLIYEAMEIFCIIHPPIILMRDKEKIKSVARCGHPRKQKLPSTKMVLESFLSREVTSDARRVWLKTRTGRQPGL